MQNFYDRSNHLTAYTCTCRNNDRNVNAKCSFSGITILQGDVVSIITVSPSCSSSYMATYNHVYDCTPLCMYQCYNHISVQNQNMHDQTLLNLTSLHLMSRVHHTNRSVWFQCHSDRENALGEPQKKSK